MANNRVSLEPSLDQLIIEVRDQFLRERYSVNPTNYDPIDIEKVKSHNYTIKRFVVYQDMNKESALNQLDESMKWRKSFNVNHIDYCDFGVEMFKTGAWFICNEDKESRPVVYVRAKTYVKCAQMEEFVKKAIVLMINKADEMANEKGFVVFVDATDTGLKHFDLKTLRFLVKIVKNYFPGAMKCALLYNFPTIFNKILPLCKRLFGSKYSNIFQVINKKEEIFDFIDGEKVPKYLGGKCSIDFTKPPPNCTFRSVELAAKNFIDAEELRKYMKLYEPHILEANLLVYGEYR